MNTVKQHENSTFSITEIKLVKANFYQKNNILNRDEIAISLNMGSYYSTRKDIENSIQLNLSVDIELFQENENKDNISIATVETIVVGIFEYKNNISEKLLPNLVSILYSYIRPIVAQFSVMAKLPPIDLPILNLSKIEVKHIEEN
ncbi:hypothetical protein [Brachyspira hyodysenteriae]|uniref:hypothetical protein n=1 Tax=Brachyspira hyodysenteriae TaxID=159 RepID=UPI00063D99EA|nr:hypothetical protein [Brachyspira hyodysenteriae]KLI13515.1 hypothetical protein SU45_13445 [Brachyspira hyodysenteriae]KLI59445.1 hypothetical protein SZ46_08825 [Brachyspira hyodysenteriae]